MRIDKEVDAIELKDIERIRNYLRETNKIVILALLNIGLNTALRFSDLQSLKFEDIEYNNTSKMYEKKTSKKKTIKFNQICLETIEELKVYYKNKGINNWNKGYIFKSQCRKYLKENLDLPITNWPFNRYLKEIQLELGIKYHLGSHSLRKTWGKYYYLKTKDIGMVMKILNHSSPEMSLRYIGLDKEKICQIYENFCL